MKDRLLKGVVKMKIKTIIMIFIVSMVVTGCGQANNGGNTEQEAKNQKAVEVMEIEYQVLTNEYKASGKIYAKEEVNISSNAKGEVTKINYNVGDAVKKGDVLYTIDNEDLMNDVNLQKSQLDKNLEDAKINYNNAQDHFNKIKALFESAAVSKTELDNAEIAYNQAKLNYEQAQKNLNSNTKSLNSSIDDTIVRSTIDGIVSQANVEIGEMTTGNDFVIVNMNPVIIKTNVSGEVINQISKDDDVVVAIQNEEYTGRINTISPVGVNNTNIYPIEVEVNNDGMSLRPGMFADVYFSIEKIENQIIIPKKTLLSEGNEDYVYVVEGDTPKRVTVSKGIAKDGYVQVTGDIKAGDILVIKGQAYIDEATPIKIVNEVSLSQ